MKKKSVDCQYFSRSVYRVFPSWVERRSRRLRVGQKYDDRDENLHIAKLSEDAQMDSTAESRSRHQVEGEGVPGVSFLGGEGVVAATSWTEIR
jgi:hypothetical protein